MDDLATYLADHLLLLVGGNPLPNAVAGSLLLSPGGTITLVHTKNTDPVAFRLRGWFHEKGIKEVEFQEVEEANPASIVRGVHERIKAINAPRVGLNYTGGTKAMSVHAYHAVEQWAKSRGREPVFSYLDARRLEMVFDPLDRYSGGWNPSVSISLKVQLSLDDLLTLHGWGLRKQPISHPVLKETAQQLELILAEQSDADKWGEWLQSELFLKAKKHKPMTVLCPRSPDGLHCTVEQPTEDYWLSPGRLKNVSLEFPSSPVLARVVAAMKRELLQDGHLSLKDAATSCGYRDPEDFCKWLNGVWLESAVMQALLNCSNACSLGYVGMDLEPVANNDNPTSFQFDVVAVRGYQLFALSCSTDSKKGLLKSKLFEAYVRARQLGGDEARVALVSCFGQPEQLQQEMRRDVGTEEGHIRVFGRKHLGDLPTHLSQWLQP